MQIVLEKNNNNAVHALSNAITPKLYICSGTFAIRLPSRIFLPIYPFIRDIWKIKKKKKALK